MLNTPLQNAAETFVGALRALDEYDMFLEAQSLFQNDPQLRGIRKRFNDRSTELKSKQATGTLIQEEIDELRALQSSLNSHQATVQYILTRQKMVAALQECNRAVSQELGFDFASTAAPSSCCG